MGPCFRKTLEILYRQRVFTPLPCVVPDEVLATGAAASVAARETTRDDPRRPEAWGSVPPIWRGWWP